MYASSTTGAFLAERLGFEPRARLVSARRFSRPFRSTAPASPRFKRYLQLGCASSLSLRRQAAMTFAHPSVEVGSPSRTRTCNPPVTLPHRFPIVVWTFSYPYACVCLPRLPRRRLYKHLGPPCIVSAHRTAFYMDTAPCSGLPCLCRFRFP